MKIKDRLIHLGEILFLLEVAVQATLAGGALYTAETGKHLQGFWFEQFPSGGAGILSPICAAVIALIVLPSWFELPPYLRNILLAMLIYWFCNWVPFLATYYLAHPTGESFTQVYQTYFPDQWRTVAVVANLSLVSANVIMFPGLLTAIYAKTFLDKATLEKTEQKESEISAKRTARQQKQLLRELGLWPQRIMQHFESEVPLEQGRTILQLCESLPGDADRTKLYPHVRKLEDAGMLYSVQGEGKEKMYFRNVEI